MNKPRLKLALAAVGLAIAGQRWWARMQQQAAAPADNPPAFVRAGRPEGTRAVVVCAGDSLTHGMASANYLDRLRERFAERGWVFVNAGINGHLAWNLAQRLDALIACRPDAVSLLIGTNDVNATFSPAVEQHYRRQQGIRQTPTLAWYQANLAQIIDRLQAETTARIAVLSLPMLGEDLDSPMNQRINQYNAAIRAIAAAKAIAYLPLHETLVAALPAGTTPPPYRGETLPILKAIARRMVLRTPWDAISAANGLTFLTDHVHLNERGAAVIADLVGRFLEQALAGPQP